MCRSWTIEVHTADGCHREYRPPQGVPVVVGDVGAGNTLFEVKLHGGKHEHQDEHREEDVVEARVGEYAECPLQAVGDDNPEARIWP